MRYPDYVAQVPPLERMHYQLYLALKGAKERHALERQHQNAEITRTMQAPAVPEWRD